MFYVLAISVVFCLLWPCLSLTRRLYFHPLRDLPGPNLWIAFPIFRYVSLVRGRLDIDLRSFHNKYGEAVRFGPEEVSFITAQAWRDIYTHGHGERQLPKVLHSTSNPSDIISANNADHSRFRRALSHAFSAKGLQVQEPILRGYVDKLIQRLEEIAASPNPVVNIVKWYNLTTFDLIGDLAFGEPFGGLDSLEYHPSLMENRERQIEYSNLTVRKRLRSTLHRGPVDFMDSMLRYRGDKEKELTDKEMEANANILIIAGSETTATLLSGVTYWLLRTPDALRKVSDEVRSSITSDSDITFQTTSQLPYMLACLNEALRIYPPAPGGLERITIPPDSINISGYKIPPGTKVSVHQSAAYRSPLNFHRPEEFLPERWLPLAKEDASSPFYNDNRDVLQPFSIGPRNCIGRNLANAEMRMILARMLWNFDIELCTESKGESKGFIRWENALDSSPA
ncbi:hypothetical protein N7509_001262 [Penicillium cosmopolitanum]|uniref:Cytochrome P450 n=1 Tax=Penicillium cosmopolitanum TaxID=1131564 RepID=A0A9X0BEY2_9EURO|nr:uncharacterized protein N7509_001262 [Penicillium cosmopolitanum]KAJ5414635.1 hypothetical protein N7509_001262 [Penicillium cosmopolitanum]